MRKNARLIALILIAMGLSGCLRMEVLVKVRKDASGTITQRMMVKREVVSQMPPGGTLCVEQDFMDSAPTFGNGVAFVSVKELGEGSLVGCIAEYAFSDINKVSVDQNPGGNMATDDSSDQVRELMSFDLRKNGRDHVLTIRTRGVDYSGRKNKADQGLSEQERAMMTQIMRKMFMDLRVTIAVEVEGKVTKTDAMHMDGSRITLVDMDFGKLVSDETKLDKFMNTDPQTMEEAKRLMKDTPGVRVDLKDKVVVRFR